MSAEEEQDREHEDAALGPGGSAAQERLAGRMRGEKVMLDHDAAVGDAVEKGLRPVPRGMEADGPPQRAGAPEA